MLTLPLFTQKVTCEVLERYKKDKKVLVFKFISALSPHNGHRQNLTKLKVTALLPLVRLLLRHPTVCK